MNPGPLDWLGKFDIQCKSVLHIGGHYAEEAEIYFEAGVNKAVFIEGDPSVYQILIERIASYQNFEGICALLSNVEGISKFNIASNDGASSSILEPDNVLIKKPNITFSDSINLPTKTLDSLSLGKFDLIVIDVQGAESLVIEGGIETIKQAKALWVEVNAGSMYLGDANSSQIVADLSKYFVPVFMNMGANLWGDALFISKTLEI